MSVVDDIKARLDIVDVVSESVTLRKAGRGFKALCPFHSEKTPSFVVTPERQSWRCFGACSTGGDAFSFVMRREGLDFGGAIRLLAERTGVELSPRRTDDRDEKLYQANSVASRFYSDYLRSPQGRAAVEYLERRGVDEAASSRFELGLSPTGSRLKEHLAVMGVSEESAVEAGLLYRGERGDTWDFFRGRLMFPIHDRRGRVSGFGARAMDDSMPKYINTAGTPIFNKRSILYGLHLAATPIRSGGTGVIVEGYMDVIAAHQHGYDNVVASMGTALTEQQVSQLRPLASEFVLALDPDVAGQEATINSLATSWKALEDEVALRTRGPVGPLYSRNVPTLKIAALPPDRDPDLLIRQEPGEWLRLVEEATPLMDFCIDVILPRFGLEDPQGKTQAARFMRPLLLSRNPVEQDHYLQKIAAKLGVGTDALKAGIGDLRRRGSGRQAARRTGTPPSESPAESPLASSPESSLEDYALAVLLQRPELRERAADVTAELFHRSEARELFTQSLSCSTIDELRASVDGALHPLVDALLGRELVPSDTRTSEAALDQSIRRLQRRHALREQEDLLASEDPTLPPPREIEAPVAQVNARIRHLSG